MGICGRLSFAFIGFILCAHAPSAEALEVTRDTNETDNILVSKADSDTGTGMKKMERLAQRVRELRFKKPVTYKDVTKVEVKKLLNEKMNEMFPEKEFNDKVEAYVKMGLIKSAQGVREQILDMLSEQIAGFYDEEEHVLYTITDLGLSEEFERIIYIHELTHALQDQHFDLGRFDLHEKDNDDRVNAIMGLIEGDATLVIVQYFWKHGRFSLKLIMEAMFADQKKFKSAPLFFRRNLMFPYSEGLSFAMKLYTEGGWESIDAAFDNPPQSTEQILHPEKYMTDVDRPTKIKLPDLRKSLGENWRIIEDNVLGELNTQVLFQIFHGKWSSRRPSRGWDGDRFQVLKHGDSGLLLVWATVWDSDKDAEEFFSSYIKLLGKKYPEQAFRKTGDTTASLWISDRLAIYIGRQGHRALTIEAPSEDLLARALDRFRGFKNHVPGKGGEGK